MALQALLLLRCLVQVILRNPLVDCGSSVLRAFLCLFQVIPRRGAALLCGPPPSCPPQSPPPLASSSWHGGDSASTSWKLKRSNQYIYRRQPEATISNQMHTTPLHTEATSKATSTATSEATQRSNQQSNQRSKRRSNRQPAVDGVEPSGSGTAAGGKQSGSPRIMNCPNMAGWKGREATTRDGTDTARCARAATLSCGLDDLCKSMN